MSARALPFGAQPFDVSGRQAASGIALLLDALLIVCSSVGSSGLFQWLQFHQKSDVLSYAMLGALVAVLFVGLTRLLGGTYPIGKSRAMGRARIAIAAWILTFFLLAVMAFALKSGAAFSRGAVLTFFTAGMPLVVASRVVIPRLLARFRFNSIRTDHEIIIAASRNDERSDLLASELKAEGHFAVHTIIFDGNCPAAEWPQVKMQLLRALLDVARRVGHGEIYLLTTQIPQDRAASIVAGLRLVPRAVLIVPDESLAGLLQCDIRPLGNGVAVEIKKAPLSTSQRIAKRIVDVVVSSIGLLFLAPLIAAIALAVKIDSRGPIFFRQRRNGMQGRPFRIFKFRTMNVMEDGEHIVQARRDDERFTRVGRWLRKTSLDELPQLLNVIRGEMSLIGPRPHAIAHDEQYSRLIENYQLRQHVKPGITGWAQVHGLRGSTPSIDLMYRRIEFDLWYAANCNLLLDVLILFRTPFAIWGQDNAF